MDEESHIDQFISEHKLPLAMGAVGLVLLIGGMLSSGLISKTFTKSTKSGQAYNQPANAYPSEVKVDVSGAVVNPGVYSLASSSRVEDAIKAAGGVTGSADPVYVSKSLNLAQKVSDGMKVFVPEAGQSAAVAGSSAVAGASVAGLVNINNASLSELDTLPGVGPAGAQRIIDGRPYGSVEELLTKKAVTRSVYDKIKGMVSVW